VDNFSPGP